MIEDFWTAILVKRLSTSDLGKYEHTLFHEVFGKRWLRAELARGQGQRLFRLAVERRVLNKRVHEDPHVILNLRWLHGGRFVLLLDRRSQYESYRGRRNGRRRIRSRRRR